VSELERVGRLPVFVDEEQWSRAFDAAYHELKTVVHSQLYGGDPLGSDPNVLKALSTRIATAALRAAAQDAEGDIGELPGVTVSHVDGDS
jgi:hypothetical protein